MREKKKKKKKKKKTKQRLESRGPHVTKPFIFRSCSIRQAKTGLTGPNRRIFSDSSFTAFRFKGFFQKVLCVEEMPARRLGFCVGEAAQHFGSRFGPCIPDGAEWLPRTEGR